MVKPDGTGVIQITDGEGLNIQPDWGGDGWIVVRISAARRSRAVRCSQSAAQSRILGAWTTPQIPSPAVDAMDIWGKIYQDHLAGRVGPYEVERDDGRVQTFASAASYCPLSHGSLTSILCG